MTQQAHATGNKLAPRSDKIIPVPKAMNPATGDCVASMIAGNVITERVT